jgi:Protein of unknown function (DUF3616)
MAQIDLELTGPLAKDGLSLSGVAVAAPDHLFVAPDEGGAVLRMVRDGDGFRADDALVVADLVAVAGEPGDEIDLEGLDVADGALWLVGSHSAVRTRIKKSTDDDEVPALLRTVTQPPARRLLARIPLRATADGPQPVASFARPDGSTVTAAALVTDGLHTALRDDPHLGPFLTQPSKDNGLDIEGIAVLGEQVLLGLRGPVLRGWAVLLELTPHPADEDGRLRIEPPVVHFLDLGGLGIRDLARDGDDLLVLAGPTMLLDGPSRVLRLAGAGKVPPPVVVRDHHLTQVGPDLTVGVGEDHPEGIAVLEQDGKRHLLVIYDSPAKARVHGATVSAERLRLD